MGHASRLYPRRGGTFVRKGISAASIGVLPLDCNENPTGAPILAIFSTFDPAVQLEVAAQPGGVVAAPIAEPEIARILLLVQLRCYWSHARTSKCNV